MVVGASSKSESRNYRQVGHWGTGIKKGICALVRGNVAVRVCVFSCFAEHAVR